MNNNNGDVQALYYKTERKLNIQGKCGAKQRKTDQTFYLTYELKKNYIYGSGYVMHKRPDRDTSLMISLRGLNAFEVKKLEKV